MAPGDVARGGGEGEIGGILTVFTALRQNALRVEEETAMSIGSVRSLLYTLARLMGDVGAARRGRLVGTVRRRQGTLPTQMVRPEKHRRRAMPNPIIS